MITRDDELVDRIAVAQAVTTSMAACRYVTPSDAIRSTFASKSSNTSSSFDVAGWHTICPIRATKGSLESWSTSMTARPFASGGGAIAWTFSPSLRINVGSSTWPTRMTRA